jgi:hypothetical protein
MKLTPIKQIVMATEFSGCAELALKFAAFLEKAYQAAVEILHLVEIPPDLHSDGLPAERSARRVWAS